MARIIDIAPYTAKLVTEHRESRVVIYDEFDNEVGRANYDGFLKRWRSIRITVKSIQYVSDVTTVLDEVKKIIEEEA